MKTCVVCGGEIHEGQDDLRAGYHDDDSDCLAIALIRAELAEGRLAKASAKIKKDEGAGEEAAFEEYAAMSRLINDDPITWLKRYSDLVRRAGDEMIRANAAEARLAEVEALLEEATALLAEVADEEEGDRIVIHSSLRPDSRDIICRPDYSVRPLHELVDEIEQYAGILRGITLFDLEHIMGPVRYLVERIGTAEARVFELENGSGRAIADIEPLYTGHKTEKGEDIIGITLSDWNWLYRRQLRLESELADSEQRRDKLLIRLMARVTECEEIEVALAWHPMTEAPSRSEPAYQLAAWSGDEWYYATAYWHRYADLLDDDEGIERFLAGEYEWFQFYGEEPHPFDTSRFSLWREVYAAPPPPQLPPWADRSLPDGASLAV